jgi:monoamine oxidase
VLSFVAEPPEGNDMPHSSLLRSLIRLLRQKDEATSRGLPLDAPPAERDRGGLSRRGFMQGVATAAATATLAAPPFVRKARAAAPPRIAIVGGGLAGLTAALTLADAGYQSTVYEALPARAGGRTRSERLGSPGCGSCHAVSRPVPDPTWADNQVTDLFGEMIDSGHKTMQSLVSRFGLRLIDMVAAEPAGSTETYFIGGQYYPAAQAADDFKVVSPKLAADLRAAGYPTTYNQSTAGGRALDDLSLYDWIESRVPGGHASPFGQLLDLAYNIEYGADTSDQSSLNLIYLLGYDKGGFDMYGPSDERYSVDGGVGQLPEAMAAYLGVGSTVQLGWVLESLAQDAGGTYTLSFNGRNTVTADYVLMTAPFASYVNIDVSRAGFDALKLRAINELGAGRNGKIYAQFITRYWNRSGPWGISKGSAYGDGFQSMWEPTRGQPGAGGILCGYTGGSVASALSLSHPYGNSQSTSVLTEARRLLTQIEPMFPGISALWNGRATGSLPHLNPFWNLSYSYWRRGQCHLFGGYERVPQGNVFFAGEHTSVDFQGFMEGAASEGQAAARAMVARITGRKAA